MIRKVSQSLETFMPTVYNKLKSLGEINNVVPLDRVVKGLQTGQARAFVSNQDKNQDGIPDRIHMVYPTIDIDLRQNLSGITTADVSAFPNCQSQEVYYKVLNVLAGALELLQHEQDHLSGYKSHNGSGGHEEFGSEESATQAGRTAAQNFINKYRNNSAIDSTTNNGDDIESIAKLRMAGDYKMKTVLVKLANHLDKIGHGDLADRLDVALKYAQDLNPDLIGDRTPIEVEPPADLPLEPQEAQEKEDAQAKAEAEEAAGNDASDGVFASDKASERINKMASLLAGEFSSGVLGKVGR